LSPYSFRHRFCADLKSDRKFGREDIAKLMGHRSDKTQKNYGSSAQGKGGRSIDSVDASDEVRMHEQTRNFPSETRNQIFGMR
jgi:integrase